MGATLLIGGIMTALFILAEYFHTHDDDPFA